MKGASAGNTSAPVGTGWASGRAVPAGLHTEDAALCHKIRPGMPAAVEVLFERYQETVYGLAMSILMNRSDAEEAVRDVFLTMAGKANRFRWDTELHFWILRICVNLCLMRRRKCRRKDAAPIDEFLPVFTREGAHAGPVEDWSREVERRMPDRELGRVIVGFIAALPEKYLVVFALHEVQGFSCGETAQVMNLTVAEVIYRSCRATLYLRERIGRYLRDARSS